jgi:hypothetical protein
MALQGNLRDFSATEILQLLGSQKKTGCLHMEWNSEKAVVFVQEGRIISTRRPGMSKDDPLLAFLLRVHRLSDEQYRGILTIQRESDRDLEDLLVNGRYVEAEELTGYLERQILDDLMRLVRWENGAYRFDPSTRWPNPPLVRLNIEGALIEASRRVDEQKRFVTRFKDPYQLLGVRDLPDPNEPLSEEERELFGIIDGHHTVADVVDAAPLSEYEAYEALQHMLESGWLEIVGRRDPGFIPPAIPSVSAAPPRPRRSWLREAAVLVAVVAALALARMASQVLVPTSRPTASVDVFVATQVRDLRFALELYRRDRGAYPERIEDLVEDRWVEPRQVRLDGYRIHYRTVRGGQDYLLDLTPDP